jgi:hypothetical protein
MLKLVSATLIATASLFAVTDSPNMTLAKTCASKCGTPPLQFKPGQLVRVEVVNRTPRVLTIQKPQTTESITIQPGKVFKFEQTQVTAPNISLLFWDETGLALKATVFKPNLATLRVELRPNWYPPGDRSVYLRDDGLVSIL